eukprot:SAG31_NODE_3643_length_4030_cov_3.758586_3_plen_36_part_00
MVKEFNDVVFGDEYEVNFYSRSSFVLIVLFPRLVL